MTVLNGIRVLDFGRYIAGPYCATLLGYLGAEVIRMERPGGGEDRYVAPLSGIDTEGALFFQTACNKKSVTLKLGSPRSSEIVRKLVASADVVVANLPPGALKRLGLDYASLTAIKPDIILTTITAFGTSGPLADTRRLRRCRPGDVRAPCIFPARPVRRSRRWRRMWTTRRPACLLSGPWRRSWSGRRQARASTWKRACSRPVARSSVIT